MYIIIFLILLLILAMIGSVIRFGKHFYKEKGKFFSVLGYFALFIIALVMGYLISTWTNAVLGGIIVFLTTLLIFRAYNGSRY
jgi:hypothetical protein